MNCGQKCNNTHSSGNQKRCQDFAKVTLTIKDKNARNKQFKYMKLHKSSIKPKTHLTIFKHLEYCLIHVFSLAFNINQEKIFILAV